MKNYEATALLKDAGLPNSESQIWLDLGCGTGTFTYALAELLPAGSKMYAIDQHPQKLETVVANGVQIEFILADFEKVNFVINENPVGIMMGNSLHYVSDKGGFLRRLMDQFPSVKHMIIIEYDTQRANQWVPYPIPFLQLQTMMQDSGFERINKIAERASIYGQGNMYVADIREPKRK